MQGVFLVVFGSLVNVFGTSFYIRSIVRGQVKPNRMTYVMFSIAPLIGGVAALVHGATLSAVPVFVAGLLPFTILMVSLWSPHSYWKLTIWDYLCGMFSALALILWAITREPNTAIAFSIMADGFAALPTIIKGWRFPDTEAPWGFLAAAVSAVMGIIVAPNMSFSQIGFPIYLLLSDIALASGPLRPYVSKRS